MNQLQDKVNTNKAGYLLIHGFGGNVKEVQPLSEVLSIRGLRIECPSLKGHTGVRNDIKRFTYREWIESAQESFDILKAECSDIYIIGFSMGGLIAFQLARTNRVKAIITLNTPVYYWDLKRIAINLADDVRTWRFNNLRRYLNSSCKLPIKALLNFRLLLSETKSILKDVKCPVFSVQALQDDTVRKNSADYIYRNIGSQVKKLEFYEESGHLILWSKAADRVIKDITEFIELMDEGV